MSTCWQKRFELLEQKRNQIANQTLQSVTPAFDKAQAQIEKEINAWYGRFAQNNEISLNADPDADYQAALREMGG